MNTKPRFSPRPVSAACVACLGGLVACGGGTDVGNPFDVEFAAHQTSSPSAVAGPGARASAANGNVDVTGAWVVLDEFELRPIGACEVDAPNLLPGPTLVDLFAGQAPAALTGLEAAPEGYCRIEFKWDGVDAGFAGGPANLLDHAILVEGSRADGTPFVVRSRRDDRLRLVAVGGALVVDDATARLFIGFDMAQALAGLDFDTADIDVDGTIYVDHDSNTVLREQFDDNLGAATQVFDDDDDDGELGDDEADDDDSLANGS